MAKRVSKRSQARTAARRWKLTAERLAALRRLGKEGRSIEEAATAVGVDAVTLGHVLAEKKSAGRVWARGRELYAVGQVAAAGGTRDEAAAALEISREAFDQRLTEDAELRALWTEERAAHWRQLRAELLKQAQAGRVAAIRQLIADAQPDPEVGGIDVHAVGQQQLVEVLKVTRQTLANWTRENPPIPRNADGSYPLPAVVEWYVARKVGQAMPAGGTADDEDVRLKRARRIRLEQQTKAERNELLPRDEVIAGLVARAQATVAWIEGRPGALAAALQGQPARAIAEKLEAELDDLRRRLADPPAALCLPPAAAEIFRQLVLSLGEGGRR